MVALPRDRYPLRDQCCRGRVALPRDRRLVLRPFRGGDPRRLRLRNHRRLERLPDRHRRPFGAWRLPSRRRDSLRRRVVRGSGGVGRRPLCAVCGPRRALRRLQPRSPVAHLPSGRQPHRPSPLNCRGRRRARPGWRGRAACLRRRGSLLPGAARGAGSSCAGGRPHAPGGVGESRRLCPSLRNQSGGGRIRFGAHLRRRRSRDARDASIATSLRPSLAGAGHQRLSLRRRRSRRSAGD